jgi:tRNA A37 threonylcarbamoyladenosine biosynthesis protein TsaE
VDDLGLEEIGASGVLAIEWADRLDTVPPDAVRVTIDHAGEDERRITVEVT